MSETNRSLPPLTDGGAAVITGGASGIGFAAARHFAGLGLPVAIADLPGERLQSAEKALKEAGAASLPWPPTCLELADVERLRDKSSVQPSAASAC